jgi:preprotein translocase subunit SecD
MRFIPALGVLIIAGLFGWFVLTTNGTGSHFGVKLGLDLAGGTELIYKADTAAVQGDKQGALASLRDVIERRVNLFGVAEPLVQLEHSSAVAAAGGPPPRGPSGRYRREGRRGCYRQDSGARIQARDGHAHRRSSARPTYMPTGLTGRYLKKRRAPVLSGQSSAAQRRSCLHFNDEGHEALRKITARTSASSSPSSSTGQPISLRSSRKRSGRHRDHHRQLHAYRGARPRAQPELRRACRCPSRSSRAIRSARRLGAQAFHAGLLAGIIGFALVALFMILWYRLRASSPRVALVIYCFTSHHQGRPDHAHRVRHRRLHSFHRYGRGRERAHLRAHEGRAPHGKGARGGEDRLLARMACHPRRPPHHAHLGVILFWLGTSIVQGFALVFGSASSPRSSRRCSSRASSCSPSSPS